ncbi:SDR family oxidoreductase [Kibdelosporangium persicum]|uniref:NADP-dependent 3-hydroxy acid dehydrogenase YdfG n=1 Tax=Kibdelosporangium persicum TaxID=2698649 RepID=A0ABX2FHU7_9PSEU|nr:SDR family NAD(P)-dependent oxidoreductase [Kibdelosporangium persicum]NRN70318.1 NADP-dependent 3-hydroxy acid dehydrogenase YdfG [Kibdelosporangium persicum]
MPVAIVTGASKGFGRALTHALSARGWQLVVDARGAEALKAAGFGSNVTVIPGDVTDPAHREALVGSVSRLDLLVNNASALGPSPLPRLADYPLGDFVDLYETNVVAPLALTQLALPSLTTVDGTIVNVSSDAAVEAYEGWGGYGSSKAALDRLSAVLAVEHPSLRVYAFDPGDMRTDMHQAAFPGEDISDRPEPSAVVPSLLRLLDERPPSGRYTK